MTKKKLQVPVKLLNRSYSSVTFSIPKSYSDEIIVKNNLLTIGKRYLVEVIKEIPESKQSFKNIEEEEKKLLKKKSGEFMQFSISKSREFAEEIIEKEFPNDNEMLKENRVNDLAEALEYVQMKYNFTTNELTMGD